MKQQLYLDFLAEEGFRPKLDDDGDITFKYQGRRYLLWANEDDEAFFRLAAVYIWPIESDEERARALEAANDVNRGTKVGKVYLTQDDVWCAVELLFDPPEQFRGVFERALGVLEYCVRQFHDHMRASHPEPTADA
ncbi:MAG TPA: YbjN domain-containing protein [Deinococcales bacterium]|nr:YbjN domain-containing protein [Deinococcales bacterium]